MTGVVHLKGLLRTGTAGPIFKLPAGYRPARALVEIAWRASGAAEIIISSDGAVDAASGSGSLDLDSLTFRAGQ